jgi:Rps23 Pro-64 3,4-dihydroxylase Tpa1-like proline 4-hydroxylase
VRVISKLNNFFARVSNCQTTNTELINWSLLNENLNSWAKQYSGNKPFPHIVVDNFICERTIKRLLQDFPKADQPMQRRLKTANLPDGRSAQLKKRSYSDIEAGISIKQMLWELNSGRFIDWLEKLTGIPALLPDPKLNGAGLHVTDSGGLLRVHADYNRHPIYDLDRRLNLLLYLNMDWRDEYGGHLELWDREMTRCEQQILPLAGRCVIFSTTTYSYHGHPHPLTCPSEMNRKSLALYYYTNGRPQEEKTDRHSTLWQNLPQEKAAHSTNEK